MSRRIAISIFLSLTALPFFAGLIYALLYSLGLIGWLSEGFTTEHWSELFSSDEFYKSIGFSFLIAFIVIALSVLAALFYILSRYQKKVSSGILAYFPLGVPAIVVAFVCFDWLNGSGVISRFAFNLGLVSSPADFPDLVQDKFAIGILLAHLYLAIPFFCILFADIARRSRLVELIQQARSLGAEMREVIFKVAIPVLLRPALPVIFVYGIFVSGSYEIPLLLGRQSPMMFSVFAVEKLQRFNLADKPVAYAALVSYALILITFSIVIMKKRRAYE